MQRLRGLLAVAGVVGLVGYGAASVPSPIGWIVLGLAIAGAAALAATAAAEAAPKPPGESGLLST